VLALIQPLRFLLENGVGQNLTAGVIAFALGWVWSRTKFWPLHALHVKLDRHEALHAEHAAKLDALVSARAPDGDAAATPPSRER
jgi:hypothetical protein